jgi:hypothetical protein
MPFNINNIRSNLVAGGARPTLFQVVITNPISPVADLSVPFMVQAAQIPSFNLGTIEVPYMGRKIKEAGDRTFEPWTVTVMNDETFNIRDAMEAWNNAINRLERNVRDTGSSNSLSYKSQAIVTQFSKTGSVIREYQFNGIYPAIISPIDLDWNNTDTIETFSVTFDYDEFFVIPGATGSAGGV